MLVSNIDYDEYVGKIAVGKIKRGKIKVNEQIAIVKKDGTVKNAKAGRIYTYSGLKKIETESASAGEIVCIAGLGDFNIGETLCSLNNIDPLPVIEVDEPTISMNFIVNNSPLAGKEGKFVTSRHLRERLFRELNTDVSLRVEETENTESYKVSYHIVAADGSDFHSMCVLNVC